MNKLTKRESIIMDMFVAGYEKEEIAKKLGLTTNVTNKCVSNIYHKLIEKYKKKDAHF